MIIYVCVHKELLDHERENECLNPSHSLFLSHSYRHTPTHTTNTHTVYITYYAGRLNEMKDIKPSVDRLGYIFFKASIFDRQRRSFSIFCDVPPALSLALSLALALCLSLSLFQFINPNIIINDSNSISDGRGPQHSSPTRRTAHISRSYLNPISCFPPQLSGGGHSLRRGTSPSSVRRRHERAMACVMDMNSSGPSVSLVRYPSARAPDSYRGRGRTKKKWLHALISPPFL